MAKIIKVGPTVTPKLNNSFRNVKNTTTNPFKYSNFEGNTLQFADVFEGFEPKSTSRLKIIAASVVGTMNKARNTFEPIIAFAKRIKEGTINAWEYANNTTIGELPFVKDISTKISNTKKGVTSKYAEMRKGIAYLGKTISDKTSFLDTDITDIGKMVADKWTQMIAKYSQTETKITKEIPVKELETMWKESLEEGDVA